MQLMGHKTTNVRDGLFLRLAAKGLTPVEVSRLIKDFFNIRRNSTNLTLTSLNRELERLGWKQGIIDELSLGLLIFLFENEARARRENTDPGDNDGGRLGEPGA
jgi:hypothetical protein